MPNRELRLPLDEIIWRLQQKVMALPAVVATSLRVTVAVFVSTIAAFVGLMISVFVPFVVLEAYWPPPPSITVTPDGQWVGVITQWWRMGMDVSWNVEIPILMLVSVVIGLVYAILSQLKPRWFSQWGLAKLSVVAWVFAVCVTMFAVLFLDRIVRGS